MENCQINQSSFETTIVQPNEVSLTTRFARGDLYTVCEINGSKFALFNKCINKTSYLKIDLQEYNIVILKPIEMVDNITIIGKSIIIANNLTTDVNDIELLASDKFVCFGSTICSGHSNLIYGKKGCDFLSPNVEIYNTVLEEFEKGIEELDGEIICEAILDIFNVIDEQILKKEMSLDDISTEIISNNGNKEEKMIDPVEAFNFFNIPHHDDQN